MAYQGFLIQIGGFKIGPNYIKLDSYQVTWNSQDLHAYRDATGELHRTALAKRPVKVEFYTRNMMTNKELSEFMQNINNTFVGEENQKQRRVEAIVYIPEKDAYINEHVYMADCTPSIYRIDGNTIYYNSFRMAFIGYGDATGNLYD